MNKFGWLLSIISCLSFTTTFAQYIFESNSGGGAWTSAATWTCRADLVDCTGAPSVPGATDIALISSNSATAITISGSISVGDVYVMSDVAASKLRRSGPLVAGTLTINGQLVGIAPDLSTVEEPVNAVFENASNLTLAFNGSNGLDPVITSWGHNAPLPRVTFSTGSYSVESFSVRQPMTVSSGTVQIASGHDIRDFSGTATLTISTGATLSALGNIGRGTDPTNSTNRFNSITINGTLTTGTSSYVNAVTFNVASGGTLNVGFTGANQTQGWWYQSNAPTTISLNAASTVNYTNGAQNVFATSYGALGLSSISTATKTLSGSGLTIQGSFTVGANTTFNPGSQVDFTGTSSQTISGTGSLNFAGGIEVNKSTNSLVFGKALSLGGAIVVTAGTLDLGNFSTTLSAGNIINSGIITSGSSGTLTISGTTVSSGSGTLTLNNLSVGASGNVTFNNTSMSITGNIVNSGSLSFSSTSTVSFTGGTAQAISGNSFSVGNMTMNKTSSTLSVNGTLELTGTLTMTQGTLDADGSGGGNFILNSDTNGDARVGTFSSGSIIGEVTFERYFDNSNNRWRNIGFPVTSVARTELATAFTLSTNSIASYTESTTGNVDQGWNYFNSGTANSRLGYSAYMYNTGGITISVKGPLLQATPATSGSPYDFQVTYTDDPAQPATEDGWNFLPNPFASAINWNAASGWTKTRVNGAAAVWDTQLAVYHYSNVDWDGVLAQGQAFWVQTNAANPVLTCTEAVKVTTSDPEFFRKQSETSSLFVALRSDKHKDVTKIQFADEASVGFDAEFDAIKLKNGIFNLSSLTEQGMSLAANVQPAGNCEKQVRLNITNIEPGSYTLSFAGIGTFERMNGLSLVDTYLNKTVEIGEDSEEYAFDVSMDARSYGSDRFQLVFDFSDPANQPVITREESALLSSYQEGNQWYFNGLPVPGATESTLVPFAAGEYFVSTTMNGCTFTSSTLRIAEVSASVYPNPASTTDKLKVNVAKLNGQTGVGEVVLYSMQGQALRRERVTGTEFVKEVDLTGLTPGAYLLVFTAQNGQVLQKSKVTIR